MRRALAGLLTSLLTIAAPALAWNDHGHMVTAAIAWQVLDPPARRAAVRVLRAHPRYHEDFLRFRPAALPGSAAMDRWLFLRASVWPDLARRLPDRQRARFHHGRWHYINQPIFLSPGQARDPGGRLRAALDLDGVPDDPQEMNAVQAYKFAAAVVGRGDAPEDQRGLFLGWLVHIAGDLHQPLHTVSLYHRPAFPDGDRGGNALRVDAETTLHALWDAALGDARDLASVRSVAAGLMADDELMAGARRDQHRLDPETWLAEGLRIAGQHVYTAEVRVAVRAAGRESDALRVDLSPDYRLAMAACARQRVLIAGLRLGEVLNQLLSNRE